MSMTTQGATSFEDRRATIQPAAGHLADSAARLLFDAWQGSPADAEHARLWDAIHAAVTDGEDADAINEPVSQLEEHMFLVGFETARRLLGGAR